MLARMEPAETTATRMATNASTRSNQPIRLNRSAMVASMGQAKVKRLPFLL
jgi:hypothetical protein